MTLIPELELQLTEAAASGQVRRRTRLLRGAAAALAAILVAGVLFVALGDPGDSGRPTAAPANGSLGLDIAAGTKPELRDVMAVFRREPTPRDDYGLTKEQLDETGDRQPGEDPTRSRRIDLPSGPVYLWPMRDGVCASWGNCLSVEALIQVGGVAIATAFSGTPGDRIDAREVSGMVVDGIKEVRLTRPGADDIVVPVKDGAFRLDLTNAGPAPTAARWRDAAGEEHVFKPLFPR
jgi:hypothetical protein